MPGFSTAKLGFRARKIPLPAAKGATTERDVNDSFVFGPVEKGANLSYREVNEINDSEQMRKRKTI